ncbi:unnamed protein product [Caenorhabditis sp. 36 PRJEB53466]|nr:unnamed protein product [Caenorhabditis sp. 36 PRJEB53466]
MNAKLFILISLAVLFCAVTETQAQYYGYGYGYYPSSYYGYGSAYGYGYPYYGGYGYYGKREAGFGGQQQAQQGNGQNQ